MLIRTLALLGALCALAYLAIMFMLSAQAASAQVTEWQQTQARNQAIWEFQNAPNRGPDTIDGTHIWDDIEKYCGGDCWED